MGAESQDLAGVRIVILRENDFAVDARVRKQAATLAAAGAEVTLIGRGTVVAQELLDLPAQTVLIPHSSSNNVPRLGRESVWWPIRVAVNLTYGRVRKVAKLPRTALFGIDEDMLAEALKCEPDVVQAIDTYTLATAIELKRRTGCGVVFECLDLVGDVDYHDDATNARLRVLEAELIHKADAIVTVSEPMASVLRERHGVEGVRVVYSAPVDQVCTARPVSSPPRLLFQGAFLENRNLRSLIESIALMKQPALLTLQGFGALRADLELLVEKLGVSDRVHFAEPVSPSDVVRAASRHDIGVICYQGDVKNLEVTVPNKLLDYLGAGLALAVSDLPGPRSVLEGSDAVHWVDPSSPEAIAEALDELCSDIDRISMMKYAALSLAPDLSWSQQETAYLGAHIFANTARTSQPLAGVRVAYVSVGGFAGVWRSIKQAHSASDAGAEVVFVGYDALIPKPIASGQFPIHRVSGLKYTTSSHPFRVLRVATNVLFHHPHNLWVEKTSQKLFAEAAGALNPSIVQAVDLPSLEAAAKIAESAGAALIFDSGEYWRGFVDNPDMGMSASTRQRLLESERRNIGKCAAVFTTSEEMAQRLAQDYGIRSPLPLFNAPPERVTSYSDVSSPLRLVFHGGLSRDRNLPGLIRAIALLHGDVTLDIHGAERTQGAAELRALIDSLGMSESVRLCGPFNYSAVVPLLSNYDVGVMAACMVDENFRYTLPNKVFDCMCAGLAVAMSDSPPMRSLIERAGFGIALDPSSPESIARGLQELVDSPERVRAMKASAIEASEHYWWPVQGKKVVETLSDITRVERE